MSINNVSRRKLLNELNRRSSGQPSSLTYTTARIRAELDRRDLVLELQERERDEAGYRRR